MDNKVEISAVIIARNASQTIETTLASLARFSEVVLVDTGSTDDTIELSKAFPNVVIYEEPFMGFGPTKNLAVKKASFDWVFSVDSDESLDGDLIQAIFDFDFSLNNNVGVIHRKNFFLSKRVKYGGWGTDFIVRLFNKKHVMFNSKMVHESVELKDDTLRVKLNGYLDHQAVLSLDQLLEKHKRYSALKNHSVKPIVPIYLVLIICGWKFFQTLILRRSILDGWRGVVIAFSNASGAFWKYARRYEDAELKKFKGSV